MKFIIFSFVVFVSSLHAQSTFRFHINNINMPMDNKGILADVSIPPGLAGGRYDDIVFLFSGGFWLSGYNGDTLWANAQASASLIENYQPGNVDSNQYDPRYQVYVIQKSDPAFGYQWQQWKFAVNLGADFYDGDGDGEYNPIDLNNNGQWDPNEDRPDIIGDQIAWCVFNDAVFPRQRFENVPPLGIEIRQTVFGYTPFSTELLTNVLFIRYEILNTGKVNSLLDSLYFTAWADPDLGDHSDDLVGCDTITNSGFLYNSGPDMQFGNDPPAFFINLLQGPYTYIPGKTFIDINSNGIYDEGTDTPLDTAYNHQGPLKGFQLFPGAKNQIMTAFTHYQASDPDLGAPNTEFEARNYMLGKLKTGEAVDPCNWNLGEVRGGVDCSLVNPFYWYSGDPESDYGWINTSETDQRMCVHSGPFSLEVDKPITIIVGYTIGQGDTALNSVTVSKEVSAFVQQFYQSNFDYNILPVEEDNNLIVDKFKLYQNYPNPFNPITKIRFTIPVTLSGVEGSLISLKVYDVLGTEVSTLVNEERPAGSYEVEFDGNKLASGIYFYQLKASSFIQTKKMLLIK